MSENRGSNPRGDASLNSNPNSWRIAEVIFRAGGLAAALSRLVCHEPRAAASGLSAAPSDCIRPISVAICQQLSAPNSAANLTPLLGAVRLEGAVPMQYQGSEGHAARSNHTRQDSHRPTTSEELKGLVTNRRNSLANARLFFQGLCHPTRREYPERDTAFRTARCRGPDPLVRNCG